jgi:nucleoside-diphosphate-sugar epimerase
MQCHPINNYGKAKLDCTNYLLNLFKNTNLPCVIFRLFQVYGPNQYTNRIIPFVINKSIQNQSFAVTKANQIRDFCYVEDIVEAIFKSLNNKKVNGKIINLGSSKPIQLKKLIELIKNLIKKGKPLYGKKKIKVKENLRLYPDITKAKVLLKWSPKFNLIRGVKKTIKLEI